jgi:hypothetical protein
LLQLVAVGQPNAVAVAVAAAAVVLLQKQQAAGASLPQRCSRLSEAGLERKQQAKERDPCANSCCRWCDVLSSLLKICGFSSKKFFLCKPQKQGGTTTLLGL